jgi:transaldolase
MRRFEENGEAMKAASALLRDLGQSLWRDNITRDLLNNGRLEHYIKDLWITGLNAGSGSFSTSLGPN